MQANGNAFDFDQSHDRSRRLPLLAGPFRVVFIANRDEIAWSILAVNLAAKSFRKFVNFNIYSICHEHAGSRKVAICGSNCGCGCAIVGK